MAAKQHLLTFAKSTLVSLLVIVVEVALIFVGEHAGVPDWVGYAGVQIVGTAITFTLNKYWTFEAGHGSILKQGAKALVVFAGSFVLNTLLPSVGSYVLGLPPVVAFLGAQAIVYLGWNFPLNRWWVFPIRPVQTATASDPSSSGTSSRLSP